MGLDKKWTEVHHVSGGRMMHRANSLLNIWMHEPMYKHYSDTFDFRGLMDSKT